MTDGVSATAGAADRALQRRSRLWRPRPRSGSAVASAPFADRPLPCCPFDSPSPRRPRPPRVRRPPSAPGGRCRCARSPRWRRPRRGPGSARTVWRSAPAGRRPTRLRVICTRPSEVTSATWWRVRSRARHSVSRRSTRSRLASSTMSMKSIDDDAADVAQPELADDLLGGLEVVAGDRLLEVAAGAGELAGVDVDDGHRLGAVDHQRAAGGQPHLAVERLEQLLVDPVRAEHVLRADVAVHPVGQLGRDVRHVAVQRVPRVVARDDEAGEVLVELVAHDLDQQVGLLVEQRGRLGPVRAGLLRLVLTASHCACSRRTSRSRASWLTPSDAVRMITPASLGHDLACSMSLRRFRSMSGSLRLMPAAPPEGT